MMTKNRVNLLSWNLKIVGNTKKNRFYGILYTLLTLCFNKYISSVNVTTMGPMKIFRKT